LSDLKQNSQKFQSDNISVEVKFEPGCQVSLDITVSPKAVEAAYQKALKTINKEMSFPGFRKGHAPVAVVEEKFGKYIQEEWQNILLRTAFNDAIDLVKIYPRTEKSVNNVKVNSLVRKEEASLHFDFESRPEVPNVDLNGFKFEPVAIRPVEDKDVELAIYKLRFEHGEFTPVEGRAAQAGDFVMVDIDAIINDEGQTAKVAEGTTFEVGSEHVVEWLRDLVVGLNVGESKECNVHCDASDHSGHHHGRKVTLLEIKQGEISPLSEGLIKQVGCDSEEMLRSQVRKRIELDHAREADQNKIHQLEAYFNQKYDFDVPKSMYENASKEMARRHIAHLPRQEGDEEQFHSESEKIKQNTTSELKQALRRYLLAQQVAMQNNLKVTENDLYYAHMNEVIMKGKESKMDEQEMSRLYGQVLQSKAMEFLIQTAEAQ
jgi:trigger factor